MNYSNIKQIIFQDNNIEIDDYQKIKTDEKIQHIITCHTMNSKPPLGCPNCGGV